MSKTYINTEEIKSSMPIEFTNLKEELISLSQLADTIAGIDESSSGNAQAILDIQQHLSQYNFDNMIARITEVEKINIKISDINQSTEKIITYNDDGTVFSEEVTGDLNYKIEYGYDVAGPVEVNTTITNSEGIELNSIDTIVPGTYTITYTAIDTSGNTAEITRTVIVAEEDIEAPIISLTGGTTIDLSVEETFIEPGFTATDTVDGDLTNEVVISGDTVDTSTIGTYILSYTVSDTSSNETTVTRTVNVVDTTAPVITLSGENTINLTIGNTFTEPGYTAMDNYDGDITNQVVVGGDIVDESTVGTYNITYTVSDTSGNQTVSTRTIVVSDETAPIISLTGDTIIDLTVGDTFTEPGYTAIDNVDGDITNQVIVAGDTVDTSTVGTYVITYNVNDTAGNIATQLTRTVNVAEVLNSEYDIEYKASDEAPVITMNGEQTVHVKYGDEYIDAGAQATDNADGDKISETFYQDGVEIGSKTFTYTNGKITKVSSTNADKLQLIYNDNINNNLNDRISILEGLNIENRIVSIEERLLLETDFDTFAKTLETYEERLQTLEQFLSQNIDEIYNVSTIIDRLNKLEGKVFEGGHVIDEFIYQGENTVYTLSRIIAADDNIRVEMDGIELSRGVDSDYSIDGNQLTIHTNALKDSKIAVEVF